MSDDQIKPIFQLGDKKIEVKITMGSATKTLPEKFDFDIVRMFSSEKDTLTAINTLIMDDEKSLKMMYHFVEQAGIPWTYDEMLGRMEDLAVLDQFRDALWAAVVNFSAPLKKQMLREVWGFMKGELKAISQESIKKVLDV